MPSLLSRRHHCHCCNIFSPWFTAAKTQSTSAALWLQTPGKKSDKNRVNVQELYMLIKRAMVIAWSECVVDFFCLTMSVACLPLFILVYRLVRVNIIALKCIELSVWRQNCHKHIHNMDTHNAHATQKPRRKDKERAYTKFTKKK